MSFSVLDFGFDHYGSRPFNYIFNVLLQEKRYAEACAKFNTVLHVMGYRGGMYMYLG